MKISTKGQYALEALINLQQHAVDGQENPKNIAARRGISEHYLEQIFASLRKSGIVASTRGAQGGYRLTRPPADISAGEIIQSVEGALSPVKCVHCSGDDETRCPMYDRCVTRTLWEQVADTIGGVIDAVSLEDLIRSCAGFTGEDTPEYCI